MDRVHSIYFSSGIMVFTGSLNFLNYQTSFDKRLGVEPTMLRPCSDSIFATRISALPRTRNFSLPKFSPSVIFCHLHIFLWFHSTSICWHGYILFTKMIANISLTLSKLNTIYTVPEKKVALTPKTLFSSFTVILPLFLPNTMLC